MTDGSSNEAGEVPAPQPAAPRLSARYCDESGDCELLTSDNVLIRVHSYKLKTYSSVFEDMLSDNQAARQRIDLHDVDFEHDIAVSLALSLAGGPYWPRMTNTNVLKRRAFQYPALTSDPALFPAVRFGRKYGMQAMLGGVSAGLENLAGGWEKFIRFEHFKIALLLEDLLLGAYILPRVRHCPPVQGLTQTTTTFGSGVSNPRFCQCSDGQCKIFDLSKISLEDLAFIPQPIFWAMLKATEFKAKGLQAATDEFVRLMKLPIESSPSILSFSGARG